MNNNLNWDEYFIQIAGIIAKRSTCLRRQYGAIIVEPKTHTIISSGYNGAPCGVTECSEKGKCFREENNIPHGTAYEKCVSVHAEQNALIQSDPIRTKGSVLYLYGTENGSVMDEYDCCLLCKRMILNAHISKVVFLRKGKVFSINTDDWKNRDVITNQN